MIQTHVATLFVINPDQQTPAEKAKIKAWRQAYTAFPQRFILGSQH